MKHIFSERNFNFVIATAVLLILAVPVGVANIYLGYIIGETPCVLCGHERFGMVLIGIMGIFILRYGPKVRYIASTFLISFWFLYAALRHTANHAHRDIGMGFGDAIFGVHTYTWAIFVYWICIFAMSVMLFFIRKDNDLIKDIGGQRSEIKKFSPYAKIVVVISFLVVISNSFQMLVSNGIPPYAGTGDPARFTLNLNRAMENWSKEYMYKTFFSGKSSFLGGNDIAKPWVSSANEDGSIKFDLDYKNAPLTTTHSVLNIKSQKEIPFSVVGTFGKGSAGGIAYDSANNEFVLVSTDAGIYFTDENFNVKSKAILDKPNGNDIKITTDATMLGAGQAMAVAFNKVIYGVKRVANNEVDDKLSWRTFREVEGDLMPLFDGNRPYMLTMRARKSFTLSAAKDPSSQYLYMASVANPKNPNIIIMKFDITDKLLSEEYILKASPNLELKSDRKIGEYYITSIDIANDKMLALSKNFNSLLVIDLKTKEVVDVYPLPDIGDPNGIAIKGDSIFVLSRVEGKDKVFEIENPL